MDLTAKSFHSIIAKVPITDGLKAFAEDQFRNLGEHIFTLLHSC